MARTLKEIQAKLLAQQATKDRARNGGPVGDNAVYPFWNNPEGSTTAIRFLPDGDENNDFFWLERLIIKLPFPGVKGQPDSRHVEVQVPCTDMWKPRTCQITAAISPWWKDESLKDMARKYYRKKSYLFQGFVTENPNKDDVTPENPIRRFIINTSVFERIKSILLVQDIEHSPVDYDHGLDFFLVKTQKGQFANYDSSQWIRPGTMSLKPRPLTEAERQAISTHGLWNLGQFMPKKPDEDHLKAIMELFEASVNEELYDPERWGQYYKPNGMRLDNENSNGSDAAPKTVVPAVRPTPAPAATQAPVTAASILNKVANKAPVAESTPPWEDSASSSAPAASGSKPKAQSMEDVIAAIRARQTSK